VMSAAASHAQSFEALVGFLGGGSGGVAPKRGL
jgi:hypothetical protein